MSSGLTNLELPVRHVMRAVLYSSEYSVDLWGQDVCICMTHLSVGASKRLSSHVTLNTKKLSNLESRTTHLR